MARNDGKAEIQHYVPKFLLREFGVKNEAKEHQVFVFDKSEDRTFKTSVANIGAENRFNEATPAGGQTQSLEGLLSNLELEASHALEKIRTNRRLDSLSGTDLFWIKEFVAWQFVRTKTQREVIEFLDRAIGDKIVSMGGDPRKVDGWAPIKGKEDLKQAHLAVMISTARDLASRLSGKILSLWQTSPSRPFWLSDNPIALHNDRSFGPYGNIGFAVPGIEIYLPIHPTLLIGFWCPSLEAEARRNLAVKSSPDPTLNSIHTALADGTPIACPDETVIFLNSLQVHWSERYLFSGVEDFELARRILAERPHKRNGPRPKL